MLGVYNATSAILSVVLATPYYYNIIGLSKIYAAKPFKSLWRRARRCRRETPSGRDVVNADITIRTLILSTVGSIIIALAAPLLTAISLWANHRQNVNLWVVVQQWATRPRATCLVFPINALMGNINFEGKPQGFVITAATTLLAEVLLSLFAIKFLASQSRHAAQYSDVSTKLEVSIPMATMQFRDLFDELQWAASSLEYAIIFWISLLGVIAVIFGLSYLLLYFLRVPEPDDTNETVQPILMRGMAVLLWVPSIAIYYCSWALWHCFLTLTPDNFYCVEDSKSIDIIYCLLPVFLASWRAVVMTAPKCLPVKSFDASHGKSEAKESQDHEEINPARRDVEEFQPLRDIESLEGQGKRQKSRHDEILEDSGTGLKHDILGANERS